MPGIIQVQRSQSLELASLGLVASGLPLPEGSQDQQRLVGLIQNQVWPYSLTTFFHQAMPVSRSYGLDYALARCLAQAALFTQQPYESIDLEAYWQAAERANLNREWVNSKNRAWLAELPAMLAMLNGNPETEPIQAVRTGNWHCPAEISCKGIRPNLTANQLDEPLLILTALWQLQTTGNQA